jgi:hypothetical protein
VTEEDIDSYKVKYRFCDAEKEDLLEFYSNYGGDLTNILEFIPYSDEEDLERYACWFSLQIQADAIKCTKKFKPWLKSDVNDEEQRRLWEQGNAKLQKVLSSVASLFFLSQSLRNTRSARAVPWRLKRIALWPRCRAGRCSANRASRRFSPSDNPSHHTCLPDCNFACLCLLFCSGMVPPRARSRKSMMKNSKGFGAVWLKMQEAASLAVERRRTENNHPPIHFIVKNV